MSDIDVRLPPSAVFAHAALADYMAALPDEYADDEPLTTRFAIADLVSDLLLIAARLPDAALPGEGEHPLERIRRVSERAWLDAAECVEGFG